MSAAATAIAEQQSDAGTSASPAADAGAAVRSLPGWLSLRASGRLSRVSSCDRRTGRRLERRSCADVTLNSLRPRSRTRPRAQAARVGSGAPTAAGAPASWATAARAARRWPPSARRASPRRRPRGPPARSSAASRRRWAQATASRCRSRLRLPMLRSAQLTAFLTKLRSSKASRSTSSSSATNASSAGRLVVHGEARHKGKAGALDELLGPARPGGRLCSRRSASVEEVGGHLVAEVPGVEVGRPALHLRFVDLVGLVDERGQQAGFVVAGAPQPEGELVVVAEAAWPCAAAR